MYRNRSIRARASHVYRGAILVLAGSQPCQYAGSPRKWGCFAWTEDAAKIPACGEWDGQFCRRLRTIGKSRTTCATCRFDCRRGTCATSPGQSITISPPPSDANLLRAVTSHLEPDEKRQDYSSAQEQGRSRLLSAFSTEQLRESRCGDLGKQIIPLPGKANDNGMNSVLRNRLCSPVHVERLSFSVRRKTHPATGSLQPVAVGATRRKVGSVEPIPNDRGQV